MNTIDAIFDGQYPSEPMTMDEQVQLVNETVDALHARMIQGEDMDDEASNFVVWLGGLHKDIMLYGLQRIHNLVPNELVFDEKAMVRIKTMEDQIERSNGYIAGDFKTIDHHPWPMLFLDETTYEDRLHDLWWDQLKEMADGWVTPDMILTGVAPAEEVDIAQAFAMVTCVGDQLNKIKENYRQPETSLAYQQFHERANNYFGWVLHQSPEIAVMAMKNLMAVYRVNLQLELVPNYQTLVELYRDLILGKK
jgi:hypothetical protein